MKNEKKIYGKPLKFILHMAKQDSDWAGKAVSFERNKEIKFKNLREFRDWLDLEIEKKQPESKEV